MSSPRVRNVLIGLTLVMALSVALPSPTYAAGRGPATQDGDVWSLVLSWFSGLWNGAFEPVDGTSSLSSASSAGTSEGTGGSGTTSGTVVCRDQGMCIDPNG